MTDPGSAGLDGARAPSGSYAMLDQALWRQFRAAREPAAFLRAWLALQCRFVEGAERAVLVVGEPDVGPFSPAARWPDDGPAPEGMNAAAERAMRERQGVVVGDANAGQQPLDVAYPLVFQERLYGVVALHLQPAGMAVRQVMRQLQWGAAWVELLLQREQDQANEEQRERTALAFDLLAAALEQRSVNEACNALVTELATRLHCDPVSIGFLRRRRTLVRAVSHAAQFGERMNLVRDIGAAMDEAIDQEAVVLHPPRPEWEYRVTRLHAELARSHQAGAVLTIPLQAHGAVYGAVTLERPPGRDFDESTVELCDAACSVLGPILFEKLHNDRSIFRKNLDAAHGQLRRLIGPGYFGRKLATGLFLLLILLFSLLTDEYRATAPVVVEGLVQRSVTAPFDGYLATQQARAGSVVKARDLLATLDDRDIALERLRWSTTRRQRLSEYDRALADQDRAGSNIVQAQIDQASAQIRLLDEQLERTRIRAPFDGVILSGDLSQKIGGAVERGEELFRIAPLDSYRVILEVDETDIKDVREGQQGVLRLVSAPDRPLAFSVARITPISEQGDGRNYFRVEATLEDNGATIRPGMEGVGKISVEDRLLIRIWTEKMVDWLRLTFWKWLP